MTIGDRIIEMLKIKGIKKINLADDLGISTAAVSNFCNGKTNPSGQTISQICAIYHVRREWLEFGEGPMEEERTRNQELTDMFEAAMENPDTGKARLLAAMSKMTDDQWEDLAKLIQILAGNK